ncbi:MAG: Adenosine monophosphate-protein transferase SoFic [Actinobacteria bacterium ADurb.BinA094]|nr:MAG: Adenosine monophosphate-protein transferase SoFic [Actinobacteria bacterium ADurb.BinA094]
MRRGLTGRHEVTTTVGERVEAFVPEALPPRPPLDLSGDLNVLVERAALALGRLDSVSMLLPDTALFLYSYVRKEAVLSSQIEGTQSSLSDLLLFEIEEAPGVPLDDVVEVSGYVRALEHGLARLRGGFPVSARLIKEMHAKLLERGRGSDRQPGEFRRSQNWIGGMRPGNAHFVPPPHTEVPSCISELERFVHDESSDLPRLVTAGLAHAQFETIHPFLDGNGRIGRLLITLLLCDFGLLHEPLLYLSLYFKEHRDEYYRLLDLARLEGDWEAWLGFFLQGAAETADEAVANARDLGRLFGQDRGRIQALGRRAGSALRVHDSLKERPLVSLAEVVARSGLSFPAVSKAMDELVAMGIARELTGKKRNRVFAYDRYLATLAAGT